MADNFATYFKILDDMFEYNHLLINQGKAEVRKQIASTDRDITLTEVEKQKAKATFDNLRLYIGNQISLIIKNFDTFGKDFSFQGKHFEVIVNSVTPNFDFKTAFADKIKFYRSYSDFVPCLNKAMKAQFGLDFYQIFAVSVDFFTNPLSYDQQKTKDQLSSIYELTFFDFATKERINVSDCGGSPIQLYSAVSSHINLPKINDQYSLYFPENYKNATDDMFKMPVYISPEGIVGEETIDERIDKYFRRYNSSCSYYSDSTGGEFATDGLSFTNITDGYLHCASNHTTDFTNFIIDNVGTFDVQNRFFYLFHPAVFLNGVNYGSNFVFYFTIGLMGYAFLLVLISYFYDNSLFKQEVLIEFLRKQVTRVYRPWGKPEELPEVQGIETARNQEVEIPEIAGLERGDDVLVLDENQQSEESDQTEKKEEDKEKKEGEDMFGFESIRLEDDYEANPEKKEENDGQDFVDNTQRFNNFIQDYQGDFMQERDLDTLQQLGKVEDEDVAEETEKEKEVAFNGVNMSAIGFFLWNLKERHILLAPIVRPSIFNPRYKKMIVFCTQMMLILAVTAILLTADETISFGKEQDKNLAITNAILRGMMAAVASDLICYIIVWFFMVTAGQRNKLVGLLKTNKQLKLLRRWYLDNLGTRSESSIGLKA